MKTDIQPLDTESQQQADEDAVMRHAFDGEALDAEIARRVQEQGRRITEKIRLGNGLIDDETFQSLLNDEEACYPASLAEVGSAMRVKP